MILEKKTTEKSKEKNLNGTIDGNDEHSDASMMSADEGHDQSTIIKEEVTPKRNAQRSAKGKVTKYGSEEDDEDDVEGDVRGMMESEDNESDYMGSDAEIEKKMKKSDTKPKKITKPKSDSPVAKKKVKFYINSSIE